MYVRLYRKLQEPILSIYIIRQIKTLKIPKSYQKP